MLEFGENVDGLLQIVASDLADQLDFSQLQRVNQSFIPDNLRKQESEVIYLILFQSEELGDMWVYLLIEQQSVPSPVMGFRLLFYMVNIWDAQRRGWEDAKVPESEWCFRPIIPIVFLYREPGVGDADKNRGSHRPATGLRTVYSHV